MVKRLPSNKFSADEIRRVLEVCNRKEYASLPPSQIVPRLADQGIYVASEATIYRILRTHHQLTHRHTSAAPRPKPSEHVATGPNQVYTWDITYLMSSVKGIYFYLYLVLDLYSRKIVGWHVDEHEQSEPAAWLLNEIYQREGIQPHQLVLHQDNGSPMKGSTLLATLKTLGIRPSYSRPAVSNDNPYSESLFKTLTRLSQLTPKSAKNTPKTPIFRELRL